MFITQVAEMAYGKTAIETEISRLEWEPFRRTDLPMMQGMALNTILKLYGYRWKTLDRMALYGTISGTHGLYGIEGMGKRGIEQMIIADVGSEIFVVAIIEIESVQEAA